MGDSLIIFSGSMWVRTKHAGKTRTGLWGQSSIWDVTLVFWIRLEFCIIKISPPDLNNHCCELQIIGRIIFMWLQLARSISRYFALLYKHTSQHSACRICVYHIWFLAVWYSENKNASQLLLQLHKSWLITIIPIKFEIFPSQSSQWCNYSGEILNKASVVPS